MTCQKQNCDRPATHKSGVGNGEHRHLCATHTNERVAYSPNVWFRHETVDEPGTR